MAPNLITPTLIFTPYPPATALPTPTQGHLAITVANAGQVTQLARWGKGIANDVAWSLDGKYLAVATTIGVYLNDAVTLDELRLIETYEDIGAIAFSYDNRTLVTGGIRIRLWDIDTGKNTQILEGYFQGGTCEIAISPGGMFVAAFSAKSRGCCAGGVFSVWDTTVGQILYTQ